MQLEAVKVSSKDLTTTSFLTFSDAAIRFSNSARDAAMIKGTLPRFNKQ
jgi:hypothetical protein